MEYTILCNTPPCVVPLSVVPRQPPVVPPRPRVKYDAITATKPAAGPSLQSSTELPILD